MPFPWPAAANTRLAGFNLQILWQPGMTQGSMGREQAPARVFVTLLCLAPALCVQITQHRRRDTTSKHLQAQGRGSCY